MTHAITNTTTFHILCFRHCDFEMNKIILILSFNRHLICDSIHNNNRKLMLIIKEELFRKCMMRKY